MRNAELKVATQSVAFLCAASGTTENCTLKTARYSATSYVVRGSRRLPTADCRLLYSINYYINNLLKTEKSPLILSTTGAAFC